MEQEKQHQIKDLVVRAFTRIGDDLGDLLYDEEAMLVNNCLYRNANTEMYNDFLIEELDLILAESYEQVLIKIILCLKGGSFSEESGNLRMHKK